MVILLGASVQIQFVPKWTICIYSDLVCSLCSLFHRGSTVRNLPLKPERPFLGWMYFVWWREGANLTEAKLNLDQ